MDERSKAQINDHLHRIYALVVGLNPGHAVNKEVITP